MSCLIALLSVSKQSVLRRVKPQILVSHLHHLCFKDIVPSSIVQFDNQELGILSSGTRDIVKSAPRYSFSSGVLSLLPHSENQQMPQKVKKLEECSCSSFFLERAPQCLTAMIVLRCLPSDLFYVFNWLLQLCLS